MSLLTFLLLSAVALVVLVAWIIVKVGAEHDRQTADFLVQMTEQVVDDLKARQNAK